MGRVRMEVQPLDRALRTRATGRPRRSRDARADPPLARWLPALGPRYAGLRRLPVSSPGCAMKPATAGYSGTPLPSKLGLKPGMRFVALTPPPDLDVLLAGA